MAISSITDATRLAAGNIGDFAHDLFAPTVRLGVTGLSRAGKTVFTTALVHNLLHGGRLPMFDAAAEGRFKRAYLQPQPDYDLPRFDYERHIDTMLGNERTWPDSTRRISQLRVTIEYQPEGFFARRFGTSTLNVDIVDYPGEWLLDLPLLSLNFEEWSAGMLEVARHPNRAKLADDWLSHLHTIDASAPEDEAVARAAAESFTGYLRTCRDDEGTLSTVPPGRFLMPGEFEGSPLLTFSPLDLDADGAAPKGSLWAMMAARFEAYKHHVVKPFFRNHFARLDRQIVLVDTLTAMNAGPSAVAELSSAITDILKSFRPGRNSWLSAIVMKRIDRIVFAATKADHLHHTSHDRLEAITGRLVQDATNRAEFAGADVDVVALAAVRATREATARQGGEDLPCIMGVPEAGQKLGRKTFSGEDEVALFPGDLPENPDDFLKAAREASDKPDGPYRFLRFRPPVALRSPHGTAPLLPHIRLDNALNFLLADHLE